MDCIFCKVAGKEIPAPIIYEDDDILIFDDKFPKAPTHKLIIPKKHIATINDLTDDDSLLIGQMVMAAKRTAQELGIAEDGYRLVMNCNEGGGQAVFHLHLHLLGGRALSWPPG